MAAFFSRFRKFQWWSLVLLMAAGWLWWKITFSGSFGDEQENFVASWLVHQQQVPYRDFFFHHAPLPYFLGSVLFFFESAPWELFRWLMLGWFLVVGWLTWVLSAPRFRPAVVLSWMGLAVMAPLLQLQQYLAESLVTPLVVSLLILSFSFAQTGSPKLNKLLGIWVIFGWLMIGCTVMALPIWIWLSLGLVGTWLVSWLRPSWAQVPWLRLIFLAVILFGGSVGYFWQQGALQAAWWDIIVYNFQYYFPVRLAANTDQVQWGFALTVVQNFYSYALAATVTTWQATDALIHTVFTTVMAGLSLPGSVLQNWLLVAWTEWQHKVITLTVLSWLGWVLVALFAPPMRWRLLGILWWLGLAIALRGRENEVFKLSIYYSVILVGVCGVTWHALTQWWSGKRGRGWNFLALCLCVSWLIGWLSLFIPDYIAAQKLAPAIIPAKTQQAADQLRRSLETLPGIQSQQKIYVLGGNPMFYALVQRLPVIPEFYYHPWFHKAPEIQTEVSEFLNTTTTVPVVLESELNDSSLEYASELEQIVRSRSVGNINSLYWMTE